MLASCILHMTDCAGTNMIKSRVNNHFNGG